MTINVSNEASYLAPKAGDVYITAAESARVQVRRVARDGTWADIRVTTREGASWTKRQPLNDGRMPYLVRDIAELIAAGVPLAAVVDRDSGGER